MFPLLVSSRVMVNDRLGTVKYLGPIDNLSGEWLGIDWDQPNYGKHDGSYRGKRYFQTKFTSSGSFIRYIPNVVHTGISFANALTNKYANKISNLHLTSQSSSSSSSTTSPFLSTSTKKLDQDILEYNWEQKDISIEVFGLNKLAKKQCFENLEEVDLSNFPVRILKEEIEHLKSTCFNLTHLDLSGTLIQSWSELAILCKALPQLLILLLNRTRLTFSDDQLDFNLAFNRIQSLSLNETFPDIRNLESILPFFPNLQTLNLASNELESLPDFSKTPHLTVLDIQKNKIHVSKWKNLTSLSLNQLRVQENGISDLNDVPVDLYVEHLNLSHNALQEWSDINQLGSWKKLQHLRIHDNPLYHDPRNGRMQVISRLSQLKMLNGSEISNAQRNNAERYFLKVVFMELQHMHQGPYSVTALSSYPMLPDLLSKHGEPILLLTNKNHLETKLVSVRPCTTPSTAPFDLQLSLTATVLQLRYVLAMIMKVRSRKLRIQSEGSEWEDDMKLVSYYMLEDTSAINVQVL